jgi:glycine oxidase
MPAKGARLSPTTDRPDLAVVGGGIVGLAVAHRAARAGLSVRVLERDRIGAGATHVAAGMLAPVTESEVGSPPELLAQGLEAAAAWPAFAAGLGLALHARGTLVAARDRDEAEALEREHAFRVERGLRAERLRPSQARRLEPALAPTIRLALHVPDDHAVDPRAVVAALARACAQAGVDVREGAAVADLDDVDAEHVVLAAGAWSAALADVPVRPVKGQVLRLRDPAHDAAAPLLARVLRYHGGYLVPRGDGRYVLGATVEERGFDTTVTAGGVYELLRDATELVPGISELVVEEVSAGLRPGSPGNVPILERRGRVLIATGHFRNGVLLAPLTAGRVVAELTGSVVAA